MRDVKFRVWLKEIKTMQYSDKLSSFFKDYEETNIPMMQYTGLEDKNGAEIYEDDIIQTVLDDGSRFSKFIVKWNDNTASFRMIRYQDDSSFNIGEIVLSNKEVIGNIHEQELQT